MLPIFGSFSDAEEKGVLMHRNFFSLLPLIALPLSLLMAPLQEAAFIRHSP